MNKVLPHLWKREEKGMCDVSSCVIEWANVCVMYMYDVDMWCIYVT